MKKAFKILFLLFGIFFICVFGIILAINLNILSVKLDKNKLINVNNSVIFYDNNGNEIFEQSNGLSVTAIDEIPNHTKNAFISIEDKRFYKHKGVDNRAILRAILSNLESASVKQGASTITQQLIKNTHLTSEKTLKRKFAEIKLAKKLEKTFSKEQILEAYLNTIYFGDNCYGITSASNHYFSKKPNELTVNESAVLAGIVKAPAYYSPLKDYKKSFDRKNLVLQQMFLQGYLTEKEYKDNITKEIETSLLEPKNEYDYFYLAMKEFSNLIDNSPYENKNMKVYTSYNNNFQEIIRKTLQDFNNEDCEKSVVLMNKNGQILSYYSTCGEIYRQAGSTVKPFAVYAPAIESNIINSCTILNDEKTNFNGYTPSNYNEKYRGNISAKEALAFSSNVCAVKVLNYLGIDKSVKIYKSLGFDLSEKDKGLSLALGSSEKGAKLTQITSAYNVFSNNGIYTKPSCIKYLTNRNMQKNIKQSVNKIFEDDTAYIICDMLNFAVKNGTAKKSSILNGTYYAKTGTVGNENGNTDAYTISYTNEYTLGVWCGSKSNKLLPNSITGGSLPALISSEIWKNIYKNESPKPIPMPSSVNEVYIDKILYDKENSIFLADENAPERYKLKTIFKKNFVPKERAKHFTSPKIENYKISLNNCSIYIELCHAQYIDAKVFRINNNVKKLVFDTKKSGDKFTDNVEYNETYQYVIVPYYFDGSKEFLGNEVFLDKIKTPNGEFGDKWWDNNFD